MSVFNGLVHSAGLFYIPRSYRQPSVSTPPSRFAFFAAEYLGTGSFLIIDNWQATFFASPRLKKEYGILLTCNSCSIAQAKFGHIFLGNIDNTCDCIKRHPTLPQGNDCVLFFSCQLYHQLSHPSFAKFVCFRFNSFTSAYIYHSKTKKSQGPILTLTCVL